MGCSGLLCTSAPRHPVHAVLFPKPSRDQHPKPFSLSTPGSNLYTQVPTRPALAASRLTRGTRITGSLTSTACLHHPVCGPFGCQISPTATIRISLIGTSRPLLHNAAGRPDIAPSSARASAELVDRSISPTTAFPFVSTLFLFLIPRRHLTRRHWCRSLPSPVNHNPHLQQSLTSSGQHMLLPHLIHPTHSSFSSSFVPSYSWCKHFLFFPPRSIRLQLTTPHRSALTDSQSHTTVTPSVSTTPSITTRHIQDEPLTRRKAPARPGA